MGVVDSDDHSPDRISASVNVDENDTQTASMNVHDVPFTSIPTNLPKEVDELGEKEIVMVDADIVASSCSDETSQSTSHEEGIDQVEEGRKGCAIDSMEKK